jgi:hypothetical protein
MIVWASTIGAVVGPRLLDPSGAVAVTSWGRSSTPAATSPRRCSWGWPPCSAWPPCVPTRRVSRSSTNGGRVARRGGGALRAPTCADGGGGDGRRPLRDGADHDRHPDPRREQRIRPRHRRQHHQRPHARDVRLRPTGRSGDRPGGSDPDDVVRRRHPRCSGVIAALAPHHATMLWAGASSCSAWAGTSGSSPEAPCSPWPSNRSCARWCRERWTRWCGGLAPIATRSARGSLLDGPGYASTAWIGIALVGGLVWVLITRRRDSLRSPRTDLAAVLTLHDAGTGVG